MHLQFSQLTTMFQYAILNILLFICQFLIIQKLFKNAYIGFEINLILAMNLMCKKFHALYHAMLIFLNK